jgi:hypothetical protein
LANAQSFAIFALILAHWFPTAENPTPILFPISFKLNPDSFLPIDHRFPRFPQGINYLQLADERTNAK